MPHRPPPPTGRHFRSVPSKVALPELPSDNPDPAEARRRAAERAAKAAAAYAAHTASRAASGDDTSVTLPAINSGLVARLRRKRPEDAEPSQTERPGAAASVRPALSRTPLVERMHPAYNAPAPDPSRTPKHGGDPAHRQEPSRQRSAPARPRPSTSTTSRVATQAPQAAAGRAGQAAQRKAAPQASAARGTNVARSSAIMFLGTFVSRMLGMVRSPILLGAIMGMTSPAVNSFAVANKLPNLIYMIVVGGLVNAVLVPSIVRATKESDDGGEAFLNKLLTLTIVFLGGITLVLTLGAPVVVKLFASQMSQEWYSLAVAFAFWCLPQVFFYGLYTVLGQILNARENFGPYMWAPAINNIVAIIGFLVFLAIYGGYGGPQMGPEAWTADKVALLGGVSTLGIVCQALILVWPMRKIGIRYRPDFAWRGAGLGAAGRASWWMLLTMLTSLIPTAVLSNVSTGTASRAQKLGMDLADIAGNQVYDTAYMYYSLPTSLIVVSIATAMFTRLAKSAVDRNMAKMRADTSKTLRMVSTLMLLASAGMIALAVPVIRVLGFTVTPPEAVTVARVLVAMCLGLVGIGAVTVLDRVYYAFEDTRGAFWVNLPFQILGIIGYIICGFLPPQWSVVGIGIVMSTANIACAIVMIRRLSPRMGGMDEERLLRTHVKLIGASSASVLVTWLVTAIIFGPIFAPISFMEGVIRLVVGSVVVIGTYLGAMRAMQMEELTVVGSALRSIAGRLGGRR